MIFSLFPINNFPNGIFAFVFSLLFIIMNLFELRILLRNRNKGDDKYSLRIVLFGIWVPLIVMILLSFTEIGRINNYYVNYFGLFILIIGFILRQYSIATLGKFFVPVVRKHEGQKIIKQGPYKLIRHPSYTGLFLELLGVSLIFANYISFLLVLLLFLPSIGYRIYVEEKFLVKNFKDYREYMKETWKLIPLVY